MGRDSRIGRVLNGWGWVTTVTVVCAFVSLTVAPAAFAADGIAALQSSVVFPQEVAGGPVLTEQLAVLNTGTTTLNLVQQASSGFVANLSSGTCAAALAPGAQCETSLTVGPGLTKSFAGSASSSFCSGACSTAVTATVPAIGIVDPADTLNTSPATLAFATTAVQELSQAQTITVTNGLVAMTLGTLEVSGVAPDDFVILHDSCSGTELSPGATCSFDVRFAPTATGARSATLTVQGTTLGNVYPTIALAGTGGSLPTGAIWLDRTCWRGRRDRRDRAGWRERAGWRDRAARSRGPG